MEVLIYIGIFINQLGLKHIGDWLYKKHYGKVINHAMSAGIDGVIYFASAYLLFCAPDFCSVLFMIGLMLATVGSRWVFYDLLYNWINHHRWNHYGTSSWQDRQLTKLGKYHMIPKFLLIILGIILIFI